MKNQALLFSRLCLAVIALAVTGLCGCKSDTASSEATGNAGNAKGSGATANAASSPAADAEANKYLSRYHRDGQGNPTR